VAAGLSYKATFKVYEDQMRRAPAGRGYGVVPRVVTDVFVDTVDQVAERLRITATSALWLRRAFGSVTRRRVDLRVRE
jgi:hypothetical protein